MALATRLPGFRERTATVKGSRVRWLAGGSGEAIVLVHGLAGCAANWIEVAPALAKRFRVLVPELPGHGGSAPLAAPPTTRQLAERVVRVAELEQVERYVIAGHSLGGVVALRAAVMRPEGVRGLVLLAAAGIRSSSRLARRLLTLSAIVRPGRFVVPYRARVAQSPRLRRLVFGLWGAHDPFSLSPAAVLGFLEGPRHYTDLGGAARALYLDDPRTALHHVRCPVLVLAGARDVQVPLADAFDYARRLRAPVRVVPGCGHLLIGERPDACLDAIAEFASSNA